RTVALGLNAAHSTRKLVGNKIIASVNRSIRKVTANKLPLWFPELPAANSYRLPQKLEQAKATTFPEWDEKKAQQKVVYFPSCASRTLGQSPQASDKRSLTEVTMSVLAKAGFEVVIPTELNELCCGLPYHSKGFSSETAAKSAELEDRLWQASEQGRWPVLMDTSPCAKL